MRYFERLGCYKNSTGTCKIYDNNSGWSYDWWQVSKQIGRTLIFNDFYYSHTTSKHQRAIRDCLDNTLFNNVLYVTVPGGLQQPNWRADAITYLEIGIEELRRQIDKPRSHANSNLKRQEQIEIMQGKIRAIQELPTEL